MAWRSSALFGCVRWIVIGALSPSFKLPLVQSLNLSFKLSDFLLLGANLPLGLGLFGMQLGDHVLVMTLTAGQ